MSLNRWSAHAIAVSEFKYTLNYAYSHKWKSDLFLEPPIFSILDSFQ